jgi:hypothetical protein
MKAKISTNGDNHSTYQGQSGSNHQKYTTVKTQQNLQVERAKKGAFNKVSNRFLPLNLPLFKSEVYVDTLDILIPVTLTTKAKKVGNYSFLNTRFL